MRRVTPGGEDIPAVGRRHTGPNVKVFIPQPEQRAIAFPTFDAHRRPVWGPDEARPTVRAYTVRRFDAAAGELNIDFVLHGDHGVAARWAANARPGDILGVSEASGISIKQADCYLFVGDQAALPAIGRLLEELPAEACGQAFAEIPDATEEQPIVTRSGVALTWLHRDGVPAGRATLLIDAVRALARPTEGRIFAWIAAESAATRAIRTHLITERGLQRQSLLSIGYWKVGLDETTYHDHDHDHDDHDHNQGEAE